MGAAKKTEVGDVMSRPVHVVRAGDTLREAAMVLSANGVSGAPVVDEEEAVIGMVTESDLLRVFERQAALAKVVPVPGFAAVLRVLGLDEVRGEVLEAFDSMPVGNAMTEPVVVTAPDTPLDEAAAEMVARKVNRLPVIVDGRLVGIVSRHDIVTALARLAPAHEEEMTRADAHPPAEVSEDGDRE